MDVELLQQSRIFKGMSEAETSSALSSLHAQEKRYKKGQALLHAGDVTEKLGLVLEGSVTIESNDAWGNRTILSHVGKGQLFAETYAVLSDEPLLVDVIANEDCRILLLDRSALESPRSHWRPWLYLLVRNLLTLSCKKYMMLTERDTLLAPKRARDRIIAYLGQVYRELGALEFAIPFDQQQLADYLNLDRSVVSKELNKLKREGMLWFNRNRFVLQPGTLITGEQKN